MVSTSKDDHPSKATPIMNRVPNTLPRTVTQAPRHFILSVGREKSKQPMACSGQLRQPICIYIAHPSTFDMVNLTVNFLWTHGSINMGFGTMTTMFAKSLNKNKICLFQVSEALFYIRTVTFVWAMDLYRRYMGFSPASKGRRSYLNQNIGLAVAGSAGPAPPPLLYRGAWTVQLSLCKCAPSIRQGILYRRFAHFLAKWGQRSSRESCIVLENKQTCSLIAKTPQHSLVAVREYPTASKECCGWG